MKRGSDVLLKQLPIPIMSQQPLCWLCVCCPQAATEPSHELPSHQNPQGAACWLSQGTIPFSRWLQSAPIHAPGARQALGNSQPRQSNPSSAAAPQGKGRGSFLGVGLTSEHCIYFPSNTSRGKVKTQEDKKLMLELTVYLSSKCLSLLLFLTCYQISQLWFTTCVFQRRERLFMPRSFNHWMFINEPGWSSRGGRWRPWIWRVEILSALRLDIVMKGDNDSAGKSSAIKSHCSAFFLLHCVRHYKLASKKPAWIWVQPVKQLGCFHCILFNVFLILYQRCLSQALRQSDKNKILSSKPFSHKGWDSMQRFLVIVKQSTKLSLRYLNSNIATTHSILSKSSLFGLSCNSSHSPAQHSHVNLPLPLKFVDGDQKKPQSWSI